MDGVSEEISRTQDIPENRSLLRRTWGSVKGAVVGSCTALMFGMVILVMSAMAVTNPAAVSPHEEVASAAAQMEMMGEVEYYLPYPGILPDNPLYKLKMVRDRISLALTMEPLKKAEKQLLYADKRINAAMALVGGGKKSLGVTTATKAEKYLESCAGLVIAAQKDGQDVKSQLLTLQKATAKHAEILAGMRGSLEGEELTTVEKTLAGTLMTRELVNQSFMDSGN